MAKRKQATWKKTNSTKPKVAGIFAAKTAAAAAAAAAAAHLSRRLSFLPPRPGVDQPFEVKVALIKNSIFKKKSGKNVFLLLLLLLR